MPSEKDPAYAKFCSSTKERISAIIYGAEHKTGLIHFEGGISGDAADPKAPSPKLVQEWSYGTSRDTKTIRAVMDYASDWTPVITVMSKATGSIFIDHYKGSDWEQVAKAVEEALESFKD